MAQDRAGNGDRLDARTGEQAEDNGCKKGAAYVMRGGNRSFKDQRGMLGGRRGMGGEGMREA